MSHCRSLWLGITVTCPFSCFSEWPTVRQTSQLFLCMRDGLIILTAWPYHMDDWPIVSPLRRWTDWLTDWSTDDPMEWLIYHLTLRQKNREVDTHSDLLKKWLISPTSLFSSLSVCLTDWLTEHIEHNLKITNWFSPASSVVTVIFFDSP